MLLLLTFVTGDANTIRRSIALQQDPDRKKTTTNHQTSVVELDQCMGPLREQICTRGVKVCGKCSGVVGPEQAVLVYYSTNVGVPNVFRQTEVGSS